MTESWSMRGGLLGALLGLAVAAVILLAQYPGPEPPLGSSPGDSAANQNPSQPDSPHGMNAPSPVGGSFGGYGSAISRMTDLQLELGQIDEAIATISAAEEPFEIVNYLQKFRGAATPASSTFPMRMFLRRTSS